MTTIGLQPLFECLAQNILRLRHRSLKRIDEQQNTVYHVENALHLTAEVRMTGGIYDIYFDPIIEDRRILRKNRIPRSRSISPESITRSFTCSFERNTWLCFSIASTSVVLP